MVYNIKLLSIGLNLVNLPNDILEDQLDSELYFFEALDFKDLLYKIKNQFSYGKIGIYNFIQIDENLFSLYIKKIKKIKTICSKCNGKGYIEVESFDLMFQPYIDKKYCTNCNYNGYIN